MSRLLEQSGGVDLGYCSFCEEQLPKSTLTWVAGRWTCEACDESNTREESIGRIAPLDGLTAAAVAPMAEPRVARANPAENVDHALRYAGAFSRYGFYGVGCYLAMKYDAVSDMLHGALIADMATWLCTAWFDIRVNLWPVVIEMIGFIILTNVILHTNWFKVPDNPGSIGLAFLAFMLFFTVKGTMGVLHRMHSSGAG